MSQHECIRPKPETGKTALRHEWLKESKRVPTDAGRTRLERRPDRRYADCPATNGQKIFQVERTKLGQGVFLSRTKQETCNPNFNVKGKNSEKVIFPPKHAVILTY